MRTIPVSILCSIMLFLLLTKCNNSPGDFTSRYIDTPDNEYLHFEIYGDSQDTLVVVHGGPGAGIQSILPSVKPLSKDFTLILYDQRGGGLSALPEDTTKLSAEFFTSDLESVRSHFGISKMNILAHSFGAIIVAEYLKKYPERISKLVLHAATGPSRKLAAQYYSESQKAFNPNIDLELDRKAGELLFGLLDGTSESPMADCIEFERISKVIAEINGEPTSYQGTTCSGTDNSVKYYYQYTAQYSSDSYGPWDYTSTLKHLNTKVLVLFGEQDSSGLSMQEQWVNSFSKSSLERIPDSGKDVLSGNPQQSIPLITEFLRN